MNHIFLLFFCIYRKLNLRNVGVLVHLSSAFIEWFCTSLDFIRGNLHWILILAEKTIPFRILYLFTIWCRCASPWSNFFEFVEISVFHFFYISFYITTKRLIVHNFECTNSVWIETKNMLTLLLLFWIVNIFVTFCIREIKSFCKFEHVWHLWIISWTSILNIFSSSSSFFSLTLFVIYIYNKS